MRRLSMLVLSLLMTAGLMAENQKVTLKRVGAENKTLTFWHTSDTGVKVDWGDGQVKEYTESEVTGEQMGATIVITGDETLTSLDLSDCEMTTLAVDGAPQLKTLYISGNKLKALDVSKNLALQELDCSANLLTQIAVADNQELVMLNCSDNQLTQLNLNDCKKLEYLICYNNKIAILNYSLLDMKTVWCQNNKLKSLVVKQEHMKSVVCNSNSISNLVCNASGEMQVLWCAGNKLTKLDLSALTGLKSLDCSDNAISSLIIGNLSQTNKANLIDCSANQLTPADIYNGTFSKYYYCTDQPEVDLGFSTVDIGTYIDISEKLKNANGTRYTKLVLYDAENDKQLTSGTDYSLMNGKLKMLKPYKSVYLTISSTAYTDLLFKTKPFSAIDPTGIENPSKDHSLKVDYTNGILILKANGENVTVADTNGRIYWQGKVESESISIPLIKGIYLINNNKYKF